MKTHISETPRICVNTGFTKKDARFSKMKNIPDEFSDDREGILIDKIGFEYFINRASFMGNPVAIV